MLEKVFQKARARALIVPREHGAWGLLLVPLFTGVATGLGSAQRVWPVLVLPGPRGARREKAGMVRDETRCRVRGITRSRVAGPLSSTYCREPCRGGDQYDG